MAGDGTDAASDAGARRRCAARSSRRPSARSTAREAYVTGIAAGTKDFNDLMTSAARRIVFLFVLTLAFVLLLVTFRSIVIPIKAIVLNLLSVGAAYGVLSWVFQAGPPARTCSASRATAAIASWLPMFLFVILFGLSWTTTCSSSAGSARPSTAARTTDEAVARGHPLDGRAPSRARRS